MSSSAKRVLLYNILFYIVISQSTKLNAIEKALAILTSFIPYNQEMGNLEISRKLGFHKATVSRILQDLVRHGFLTRNSQTKKFFLGPKVMDLARAASQSFKTDLVNIARPFIDSLRNSFEETVILEVLSGQSTSMAYIAEGSRLVRLAGNVGDRVPSHASAGAKAILAFSSEETRKSLLSKEFYRFTKRTVTSREVLYRQFQEVHESGVAFDQEEIDEGTGAAGCPVFDHEGTPVAAVVIAGPVQRINIDLDSPMISELKATAEKISSQLHYVKKLS
jgi:IclR family transcriptional regulator, KDG regulon repressor